MENNSPITNILVLLFWGAIFYWVYSYFTAEDKTDAYNYNTSYSNSYSSKTKDCSTLEPDNPYSEGSGHYAGFEWGERGNSCSGNSQSFVEGCEEFERLDEVFTQCENNQ